MAAGPLKVFLVPLGVTHHLPYCEPGDDDHDPAPDASQGPLASLVRRFRHVLHLAEQSRLAPAEERPGADRWAARARRWALGWLADRIAEQRLLWQLRGRHEATLVYPSDLVEDTARLILLGELRRDGDRHRRWLVVDSVLLALSALLTIVPGPNLVAYYFAFRVVGHFFSMRGARQGLHRVRWTAEASTDLRELRAALGDEPGARQGRVREIATRLDLPHLVTFVERVALRGA